MYFEVTFPSLHNSAKKIVWNLSLEKNLQNFILDELKYSSNFGEYFVKVSLKIA